MNQFQIQNSDMPVTCLELGLGLGLRSGCLRYLTMDLLLAVSKFLVSL